MPRLLERSVDTFTPTDSTQIRRRLPLGSTLERYKIRFTGNLIPATATITILEDSPLGYLRSVDLVLGGSFAMRVHDARFLRFWNRLTRQTDTRITAPVGTVGTNAFIAEIELPLTMDDLWNSLSFDIPRAFLLDTRPLNSIELVFTFGTSSNTVAGTTQFSDLAQNSATGTHTSSALSINIIAVEALDVAGVLSRMQFSRIQSAITATGIQDTLLPGAGVAYRGIALHFTSTTTTDPIRSTSDDTILTDVSLIDSRGVRYFDSAPYEQVRGENKRAYQLETMQAGWLFLDFARRHNLDDILFTQGIQNLILRLNVGAAPTNSFVQIYPVNALLVRPRGGR